MKRNSQKETIEETHEVAEKIPDGVKTRGVSRRGSPRFVTNPFLAEAASNVKIGTKKIVNKKGDRMMIVSETTGEILAPAGFHEVHEVDRTQFVKLFINGVRALHGITKAGTAVFELIYKTIQEQYNKEQIYIHYAGIDPLEIQISAATFHRGMKEMIDKRFIAETTKPGWYWVNMNYMWAGDKLAYIKEYRVKESQELIEKSKIKAENSLPAPKAEWTKASPEKAVPAKKAPRKTAAKRTK